MPSTMILAGTGHRPSKLGGYGPEAFNRLVRVASQILERCSPSIVISGMALGWDQALAEAALNANIPLHAYIPGRWQPNQWPRSSVLQWSNLMGKATKIVNTDPDGQNGQYAAYKLQVRNERMVDDCTHLLALWDGSPGGTANCLAYAKKKNRRTFNAWSMYQETP